MAGRRETFKRPTRLVEYVLKSLVYAARISDLPFPFFALYCSIVSLDGNGDRASQKESAERHVIIDGVTASNGRTLCGINTNVSVSLPFLRFVT